jgi:hypothetical protein
VKKSLDRSSILRLAAESQLDPRTVKRAVEAGVNTLRAEVDRQRLLIAAKKLGLTIA